MNVLNRRLYVWIRELHLYFGLFISPFIFLFAVTTLLFNHTWKPWENRGDVTKVEVQVQVPDLESMEQAKAVMRQVGVTGEIQNIFRRRNRLDIPFMTPGKNGFIRVNLETGVASVEQRDLDVWDALMYLHKSPGPHNAKIRGNWVVTHVWTVLVDATVCLVLFVSVSGIYMWAVIRAERKVGLIAMGGGLLCFVLLIAAAV